MVGYSLEDVERVFGVTFTDEQRPALRDIPFPEDVLKACAGTHMLFPSLPLTLLDVRARHSELFHTKTNGWYANEKCAFSRTPAPVCWHLLRMGPVPESIGKSLDEQYKLLLSDEVVPTAALLAFATVLHHEVSKELLFQGCYVRTLDMGSPWIHVAVGGGFDACRLDVYSYGDRIRYDRLGLSSVRKS